MAEPHAAVDRERDAVGVEHLLQERGVVAGLAQHDRDVARLGPGAQQLEHGGAEQLDLGAAPAGRVEGHGLAGLDRLAVAGSKRRRSTWCSAAREPGA